MNRDNINRIKTRLLIEVAQLALQGRLSEEIDRLPIQQFPRHNPALRCCVHKSRAIIRYRLMAILGYAIEEETDELKRLSEYVEQMSRQDHGPRPILTVIDEACSACLKGRHCVTNVCKGCVARPCTVKCPKDAIQIVNGQAQIDEGKCVNCGLCLKACPYHAIVYVPIPCEEACPVGAITKDETGREKIDDTKCIDCGKCLQACPFAAIVERSQMVDVIEQIKSPRRVVAMLAPAIAGQFPVDYGKLAAAVKTLGFDDAVEVALGAEETARHEAAELVEKLEAGQPFMTSSCCPAYMQAVRKHLPEIAPFVSDTPTPMHYTAARVKRDDPQAVTVFIGPCVAKRREAMGDEMVDYVLTTDEFGAMLVAAGIELDECAPLEPARPAESEARTFAISGGVTGAVQAVFGDKRAIRPQLVDGLDKKTLKLLSVWAQKGLKEVDFIEVMNCQGGCVAGPCNIDNPKTAANRVKKYADQAVIGTC